MKPQKIAIIGAGTAGLAAATLLARQEHDITLIERAPALTAVGAGILLQPSGMGVLSDMGCLEPMRQYGRRIDALYGHIRSGQQIMQVKYAHLKAEQDLFGMGVHRASLCHILDQALAAVAHKRWLACEVNAVEQKADEIRVGFRHDSRIHHEVFDAVLIANGSASQLRPQSLVHYDRQYPWGAMWLIRPLAEDLPSLNQPCLQQRYDGSKTMLGVLPSGYTPSDTKTPMLSLFWSLPVTSMAAWQGAHFDLDGWKGDATALWPELSPLIRRIQSPSELLPATYRDVIMSRWGSGRIGIIGDAAHAMSPQLGQGANMALLDAAAIARSVAMSDDWNSVWEHFYNARQGSIRFYQGMSRLLTPFFQSNIPGAGLVRNLALSISHQLPWMRHQMAETVAGKKQGWLD